MAWLKKPLLLCSTNMARGFLSGHNFRAQQHWERQNAPPPLGTCMCRMAVSIGVPVDLHVFERLAESQAQLCRGACTRPHAVRSTIASAKLNLNLKLTVDSAWSCTHCEITHVTNPPSRADPPRKKQSRRPPPCRTDPWGRSPPSPRGAPGATNFLSPRFASLTSREIH